MLLVFFVAKMTSDVLPAFDWNDAHKRIVKTIVSGHFRAYYYKKNGDRDQHVSGGYLTILSDGANPQNDVGGEGAE